MLNDGAKGRHVQLWAAGHMHPRGGTKNRLKKRGEHNGRSHGFNLSNMRQQPADQCRCGY
jgi:hypothetical protein